MTLPKKLAFQSKSWLNIEIVAKKNTKSNLFSELAIVFMHVSWK